MKTKRLMITDPGRSSVEIAYCGELLRKGELVVIPTETVYGLAADATNSDAVQRIFAVKGRPQDNPLIVHIAEMSMLDEIVSELPLIAFDLAIAFWPGPFTMVLPRDSRIPAVVSAGLDTVAVRFPSHPVAAAIIKAAGIPIAAPSANISGRPSPTTAEHVLRDLDGKVPAVVDSGSCTVGIESTVVSLVGGKTVLLRPGAVTLEQIREIDPDVTVSDGVLRELEVGAKASSPGMLHQHYAPKARVTIVCGGDEEYDAFLSKKQGATALCFEEDLPRLLVPAVSYGKKGDSEGQAHMLFDAMRKLDEIGADEVYARCPHKNGVGLAVYNRLLRAAAFREIIL